MFSTAPVPGSTSSPVDEESGDRDDRDRSCPCPSNSVVRTRLTKRGLSGVAGLVSTPQLWGEKTTFGPGVTAGGSEDLPELVYANDIGGAGRRSIPQCVAGPLGREEVLQGLERRADFQAGLRLTRRGRVLKTPLNSGAGWKCQWSSIRSRMLTKCCATR